jgi:hypothetical protein
LQHKEQAMIKNVLAVAVGFGLVVSAATARLPAPNDEAKAKAAAAAAKTAHTGKVDSYKLCLSMNKVAMHYTGTAKAAGKTVTPTATPECADPGPFVDPATAAAAPAAPAAAAPVVAAASAAATAAKPAAAGTASPAVPAKK